MASLSAFVTCESKSNLTILLIKKLLFRDISCNFLIMVLITIASLSLSSNKLGNNVNNNLLMPLSLLLIWNRKVLSCNCLAANNNFWCCQEIKMWISGTLFEKKEIFFWHSDTCRFLNKSWTLLWKSQFQNPRNLYEKNWLFLRYAKKQLQIHGGTKID